MFPTLLPEFSLLLRDALDLMRELGQASDTHDMSVWDQPSISDHPQNTRLDNWTALIYLNRDAWLAAARQYPERARRAAESWQQESYPLFQRWHFLPRHKARSFHRIRRLIGCRPTNTGGSGRVQYGGRPSDYCQL